MFLKKLFDSKFLCKFLVIFTVFLFIFPSILNLLFAFHPVQNIFFDIFEKILHRALDRNVWISYFDFFDAAEKFLKKPYFFAFFFLEISILFFMVRQVFLHSEKEYVHIEEKAICWKSVFAAIVLSGLAFLFLYTFLIPVEYGKFGGALSWCPGHTLITVNDWLQQGAMNLNFISYRAFSSIEITSLSDRLPYITYPNGQFVLMWLAVKLCGLKSLDISFVKHFMVFSFMVETMLLSVFVYIFAGKNKVSSEAEKIFMGISASVFWALLPINSWYLTNISVSDQNVILFVIPFLLLDYIEKAGISNNRFLKILKGFVTFCGVSIDYLFWFIIFFAFIFSAISDFVQGKKLRNVVVNSLWYIIPVFMAVGLFVLEFTSVPNWLGIMRFQFLYRVGAIESEWSGVNVFKYILGTFREAYGGIKFLLTSGVILILASVFYIFKNSKMKSVFCNANYSVPIFTFSGIFTQVIVFNNHSAMHEFSMVKFGLVITISLLLVTVLFSKLFPKTNVGVKVGNSVLSPVFRNYVFFLFLAVLITGIPFSTRNYYNSRNKMEDYSTEKLIAANSDFNSVIFSFTYQIFALPPQNHAMAKKLVYKIENISEMDTKFPNLSDKAVKMLLVEKNKTLSETQKLQLEEFMKVSIKIVETDNIVIYRK